MNRLRDEGATSPTHARGTGLLRAARPREFSPEMKRRVWLAVKSHRNEEASAGGLRGPGRRLIGLRGAVLIATVLLSAASAGAMIGRRVIARRQATTEVRSSQATQTLRAAGDRRLPVRSGSVAVAVPVAAPPNEVEPSPEAVAPIELHPPSRSHGGRGRTHAVSEATPTKAEVAAKEQGAHQLIVDAMTALRRDHDANRAGVLLDRYLTGNPGGALREEALALAVEAAIARDDRPARDRLGQAYLSRYPSGRFRSFVQSGLHSGLE